MKKLLLNNRCMRSWLLSVAPAAFAQVQLELGGYFKGYGAVC